MKQNNGMDFRSAALYVACAAAFLLTGATPSQAARPETNARFGVSPDNGQKFLLDTLDQARSEVLINIYEFKSPVIRDQVIKLIRRGVAVKMLVEGDPVGGLSRNGSDVLKAIVQAMKQSKKAGNEAFLMTKGSQSPTVRRFVFNHAKYLVVDGKTVYMASENFSPGAHPNAGNKGNRGWHVAVTQNAIAATMTKLWEEDSNPSKRDIVDVLKEGVPSIRDAAETAQSEARQPRAIPAGNGQVGAVSLITSPNADGPLVRMMDQARESFELNFMSLPLYWRTSADDAAINPLVEGLLDAAARGVAVRVLLNDEAAFSVTSNTTGNTKDSEKAAAASKKNLETVCYLRAEATRRRISIQGKIVSLKNLDITYIHNKGMIADGKRVLVSSVNGTQNSVLNNRETALLMDSPDAAKYYGSVFNSDWSASSSLRAGDCRNFVLPSARPSGKLNPALALFALQPGL